jgi:hypothetical protein
MIWHGDIVKLDGKTVEQKISTRYLHLNDISEYIKEKLKERGIDPTNFDGDVRKLDIRVEKGQIIGTVGNTGCRDQPPHLHFEVRKGEDFTCLPYNTLPLNPCEFVPYGGYTTPPEEPKYFGIKALCPVDLIVTDPDGLVISKEINQLSASAQYIEEKDGEILHDTIIIHERKIGRYTVTVIPEPGTTSTDTYNLQVFLGDTVLILAENVQVTDIPAQPYILESTEKEIIPIIPAIIDFDPDTLDLRSTDRWITAYIELPRGHGYNVSQINRMSIMVNGTISVDSFWTNKTLESVIGDYDNDTIPDLMVKFNRETIINFILANAEFKHKQGYSYAYVTLIITGKLQDGKMFEGHDTIKAIITRSVLKYAGV